MRKNKIIKIKLVINTVLCLLSIMAIDSNNVIPLIICGISATWLLLFTIANTRG
jgi:hypothetical protein